jgi:dTDP-4-dehydrorhamnose reductase
MKKRILITGSNGLLGQKLVHQLLDHPNYEFLATSAGANRISKLNETNHSHLYQTLDITNKENVNSVVSSFKPNIIINTAAMTNVDACETDRENCWKLNVMAVEYLIDACKNLDAHLIHLSTDFVFDGENGPYKEDDIALPLSYYGQSKLASEKLMQNSGLKHWSIARTIIVYGVAENMSRSNIVLWAKEALEKKQPIKVVDDQFRMPTWADDLAIGCLLIADKQANGIFHLSGKDFMSIYELVERVADYFGLEKNTMEKIKSNSLNQAAKRPPKTGFVLDKSNKILGYNPISFEEGLKKIAAELN